MLFTVDDVRRLASLARLDLTVAEAEAFARQLGDILEFARQVQAVDTSGLAPAEDAAGVAPALPVRDDVVQPSLPREITLAAAADADAGAGVFKVPRVLNG